MFDIAPTELLLVALIALVVIGPKDLPRAMRFVGKWLGKARGMARHFRSGLDTMMREAELEELEKQWRQQNEEIMRQYPRIDDPAPAAPPVEALPDRTDGDAGPRAKPAAAAAPDAPAPPPKDGALP
jgi:sec-independent protein translocase protein TatB